MKGQEEFALGNVLLFVCTQMDCVVNLRSYDSRSDIERENCAVKWSSENNGTALHNAFYQQHMHSCWLYSSKVWKLSAWPFHVAA